MRGAYYKERWADAGAGAEAQRGFGMHDRDFGLARPISERAANVPPARETRVERHRTVNQHHHRANVLAEIGERKGGIRQDARIVAAHFEGSPPEIGALQTVPLPVFAPVVEKQPITAERGQGECRPVTGIARDRLLQMTQRFGIWPADDKTIA